MTSSSSPHLFGTDGIRGPFGEHPLDRPTVTALGRELGVLLRDDRGEPPRVALGGDTRASTPTICRWLAGGLAAAGAEVSYLGMLPTPGIAHLTRALGAAAGVAVSASHNPYPDNGIKILDGDGFKWSPEAEAALEKRLFAAANGGDVDAPELLADPEAAKRYLSALATTVGGGEPLAGLSVVLDPGHGAASPYAGRLFEELGAEVMMISAAPDGTNINRGCGSTNPGEVAAAVSRAGADLGIAFDGDADRAILADERGTVRDGDAILYLWASALAERGALVPPRIVATSMSNLGLERALDRRGIGMVRCDVGDRVVVETLKAEGLRLGGEQSGHVVDLELSTTGDGLLTALQMAALVARSGRSLSELLEGFRRYPQILHNVRVREKPPFEELPEVSACARRVEEALGDDGRLVLRYSGTEPLARIMIEGPEQEAIDRLAAELAAAIEAAVGEEKAP